MIEANKWGAASTANSAKSPNRKTFPFNRLKIKFRLDNAQKTFAPFSDVTKLYKPIYGRRRKTDLFVTRNGQTYFCRNADVIN
jgi:hypothetical protein